MRFQKGQVILILLLVMAVSTAVALAVVSRSLTDISTSSRIEDSTRALSAAEAGIEKIIQSGASSDVVSFSDNNSSAVAQNYGRIPAQHKALEYPPLAKEETAHVWLADSTNSDPDESPVAYYTNSSLEVYWGVVPANPSLSDRPAIELNLLYLDGGSPPTYRVKKYLIDEHASLRQNGFSTPQAIDPSTGGCNASLGISIPTTNLGTNRTFYCRVALRNLDSSNLPGGLTKLISLRARLLYNPISETFAVLPLGGCGNACSLPPQANIYVSTGSAGDTQRRVQLFELNNVVPFYLDYAIFSVGNVTK